MLLSTIAGCGTGQDSSPRNIRIATFPFSFTGFTIYVGQYHGYFAEEDIDLVEDVSYPYGKAALKGLLRDEIDLAVSSETPFVHCILEGDDILIVAKMVSAEEHLAVVGRRDRDIVRPSDLAGKKVGVTIGSNGEFVFDFVLLLNKVARDDVEVVHVRPAEMVAAIESGRVDAVTTWNPNKFIALQTLAENGVSFSSEGHYAPSFIVSGSRDFIEREPDLVERFVRALHKSTLFIQKNPEESFRIAAERMGIEAQLLKDYSAEYSFKVSLDQALLASLEDQAKWAIGADGEKMVPSFLDYFHFDGITKVVPENVTVGR